MTVGILIALCLTYNALYLIHQLRSKPKKGLAGTVILIVLLAAGTVLYGISR